MAFFKKTVEWLLLRLFLIKAGTGHFTHKFRIEKDIRISMRDGIELSADLYIPCAPEPFPVILSRLPYGKGSTAIIAEIFARYGYAFVAQDTRGKFDSQGEFYPFINEKEDGRVTSAWIRAQSWCNGKIGTFGPSYLGFTQWALAPGNPDITALAPIFTASDIYSLLYWGGTFCELSFLKWSLEECDRKTNTENVRNIEQAHAALPLIDKDRSVLRDIPWYKDWIRHPAPDDYWKQLSVFEQLDGIKAPAFLTAGWYDIFNTGQLKDFERLKGLKQPEISEDSKILIGPWNHGFSHRSIEKAFGIKRSKIELFPVKVFKGIKDWFDYSLKGIANGWGKRPAVSLYVLGENVWRDENEWPLARTKYTSFYLHSGGRANISAGDGRLDMFRPGAGEPADSYVYDPENPVPTTGGSNLVLENSGPMNQIYIEKREDVLVYSTEPLQSPIEVTGPVKLILYVSSDAPDTDFTGKLTDVFPDGKSLLICDGILRCRYREGFDKPALMEPGKVYRLEIFLGNTSVLFRKGHRIRLEVSSSNFPRFDRNPNTGRDIAEETMLKAAHQRVYHDESRASELILPVIPRS